MLDRSPWFQSGQAEPIREREMCGKMWVAPSRHDDYARAKSRLCGSYHRHCIEQKSHVPRRCAAVSAAPGPGHFATSRKKRAARWGRNLATRERPEGRRPISKCSKRDKERRPTYRWHVVMLLSPGCAALWSTDDDFAASPHGGFLGNYWCACDAVRKVGEIKESWQVLRTNFNRRYSPCEPR